MALRVQPVKAQVQSRALKVRQANFPAPVAGWVKNTNLDGPQPADGPAQGAAVLENFFPTATTVILRRGAATHASLPSGSVVSLFTYNYGANHKLFAANGSTIYDVTSPSDPNNWSLVTDDDDEIVTDDDDEIGAMPLVGSEVWENADGGDWSVVQFTADGGTYLIGVNGESTGWIYDGSGFWPAIPMGVWALNYAAEVTPFTAGEVVTGGTSGAVGTVFSVEPSRLILISFDPDAGQFQNGEQITGDDGGDATAGGEAANVVPGIEFGDSMTTANMSYVWAYKERLFFVQKDSLSFWYLDVGAIGGEAEEYPLGGVFNLGGSLLFGSAWSLSSGSGGGLSEQCVFVTTEGEVAVYQGLGPDDTQSWAKVGGYRIGRPMGKKAHFRAGGDVVVATDIGLLALSKAIEVDFAMLMPTALSMPVEDAWTDAVDSRGPNWQCLLWPPGQMVLVAPPDGESWQFIGNAATGAWASFRGWDVRCLAHYQGRLYYGNAAGEVVEAMVTGADQGLPFVGRCLPLFSHQGAPSSRKASRLAHTMIRSRAPARERVSTQFDFNVSLPPAPSAEIVPEGNVWGQGIWGQAVWGGGDDALLVTQRRHGVAGSGYRFAPAVQITSSSIVPLDAELVSIEVTYELGEIFT